MFLKKEWEEKEKWKFFLCSNTKMAFTIQVRKWELRGGDPPAETSWKSIQFISIKCASEESSNKNENNCREKQKEKWKDELWGLQKGN